MNEPSLPDRIVIGRAPEFTFDLGIASSGVEPRPVRHPAGVPYSYRPDSVVDGWETSELTVRAVSVRGDSHRFHGLPRQDELCVTWSEAGNQLLVVVADGVSGAALSHIGAATACRYATEFLLRATPEPGRIDWTSMLNGCAWSLIEMAQRLSGGEAPDPERAEALLATTLVVAVVWPMDGNLEVEGVVVGDSGLAVAGSGRVSPRLGGKAAPLGDVIDHAVVPLPRLPKAPMSGRWTLRRDEILLVGTDGIWDPVGSGSGPVGRFLAESLSGPSLPSRPEMLRIADFYRETHDDDRTLVVVRSLSTPGDARRTERISARLGASEEDRNPGHGQEDQDNGTIAGTRHVPNADADEYGQRED